MLDAYRRGKKTDNELSGWLVQMEYDDEVPVSEKDELALIRLLAIEAEEGLRPKQQLLDSISTLLSSNSRRRRTTRVKN
jgi:hypothetical protein